LRRRRMKKKRNECREKFDDKKNKENENDEKEGK